MPEALEGEAVPQRLDIDVCRSIDVPTLVRAEGDDDADAPLGTLVGEFSLFDSWYEIASMWEGNFLERISPGAFKRTIRNRSGQSPVRVLLEHGFDPTVADKPLGVPRVLEERDAGVYAETPLLDTSYNRDLAPALAAGAYGQSFRFQVLRDEWVEEPEPSDYNPKGIPERTVKEVRLIEFGPTVFPASPATNSTTGLRSSTDAFYEQLARRDTARYDAAVRTVRGLRSPASVTPPEEASEDTQRTSTEDSHAEHSETPAAPSETAERSHVEDSPSAEHSEETTTPTPSRKDNVMANMTIEERSARISDIDARLTEINGEHRGGALPADVQSEWDTLAEERVEHAEAIEAQKRRDEFLSTIAARGEDAQESAGTTAARSRTFSAPNVRTTEDPFDVNAMRTRARSFDEFQALMRDNALRALEVVRFPGAASRAAAQEHVSDLLDKVDHPDELARRIVTTGSPIYERAFGKAVTKQPLTADEQRALSLGSDADGGYAVPVQLDPTVILTSDGVTNPLRGISRVVQITGKQWEGITSEGITVTRKGEVAEANDDSPEFDQPVVDTSRVDGFVPFSYAIDASWSALRDELTMMLADAKASEEAASFVTGAGTAVSGGGTLPQGVLTGATTLVPTAASTALVRTDLYGVKNALPHRFRNNAQWLAEDSFYDAVRGLDEDGDIWAPLSDDKGSRLLGKPVNEASEMPAFALTAGTKVAVYGDFARAFLIVDRIGMSVELIPQVFGANGRPTGQRGIFAIWFNGSKVIVPQALRVLQMKPSA